MLPKDQSSNSDSPPLEEQVAACLQLESVELVPVVAGAANLGFEVHANPRAADSAPVAFLRVQGAGAMNGSSYDLQREGLVLKSAREQGFPVATVLGTFADPAALLMEVVPGTSQLDPDNLDEVAAEYMGLIARLHRANPAAFGIDAYPTITGAIQADLTWWAGLATKHQVAGLPILAGARHILAANMPQISEAPSMVHGDVGAGNFMVEHGKVTAMLDWELAHVGDPHEDLAWMWMRGAHSTFGDPQARIADYVAASGSEIDADRLEWHVAFVMWKSCVSMEAALRSFEATSASLIHTVVLLTYEALLGAQLLKVCGSKFELGQQVPVLTGSPMVRFGERILGSPGLSREVELIGEYVRDAAAQSDWEQDQLTLDVKELLESNERLSSVMARFAADDKEPGGGKVPEDQLDALALVLARAADRAAMAMPKATRRIERAQSIGLG